MQEFSQGIWAQDYTNAATMVGCQSHPISGLHASSCWYEACTESGMMLQAADGEAEAVLLEHAGTEVPAGEAGARPAKRAKGSRATPAQVCEQMWRAVQPERMGTSAACSLDMSRGPVLAVLDVLGSTGRFPQEMECMELVIDALKPDL